MWLCLGDFGGGCLCLSACVRLLSCWSEVRILPGASSQGKFTRGGQGVRGPSRKTAARQRPSGRARARDRKSTRLNSSHTVISYAVFCLKKKKTHKLLYRYI